MRCENCPLFSSWNNENGSGEVCVIFGDEWGHDFQYEDKHGAVVGCYLERAYIRKVEKRIDEARESYVNHFLEEQKQRRSDLENLFN